MNDSLDKGAREEAAQWCARLAAPYCSEQERLAFEEWRSASPKHAHAYSEARRTLDVIRELAERDDRLRRLADRAYATGAANLETAGVEATSLDDRIAVRTQRANATRWRVPLALAAGLLVAIAGLHLFTEVRDGRLAEYASQPDQRLDVKLADGSLVHLDVDSRITVQMSAGARRVKLLAGRAAFEVAHDVHRPFSVYAGELRTTALGTRFQVERFGTKTFVTLTQGSVAVANEGADQWEDRLRPGEQISLVTGATMHVKRAIDIQSATGWLRGRHVFKDTPLADALDEVNRYATVRVTLGDPTLAELPVSGDFIAGRSDLIISGFAAALPIRVVRSGERELILFRRYDTDAQ